MSYDVSHDDCQILWYEIMHFWAWLRSRSLTSLLLVKENIINFTFYILPYLLYLFPFLNIFFCYTSQNSIILSPISKFNSIKLIPFPTFFFFHVSLFFIFRGCLSKKNPPYSLPYCTFFYTQQLLGLFISRNAVQFSF